MTEHLGDVGLVQGQRADAGISFGVFDAYLFESDVEAANSQVG